VELEAAEPRPVPRWRMFFGASTNDDAPQKLRVFLVLAHSDSIFVRNGRQTVAEIMFLDQTVNESLFRLRGFPHCKNTMEAGRGASRGLTVGCFPPASWFPPPVLQRPGRLWLHRLGHH